MGFFFLGSAVDEKIVAQFFNILIKINYQLALLIRIILNLNFLLHAINLIINFLFFKEIVLLEFLQKSELN